MNIAVKDEAKFEEKRQRLMAKQHVANIRQQARQREKQQEKLSNPEYIAQQKQKQQQTLFKQQQRQQQKQQCPTFRQQQLEKAKAAMHRAQLKQQQKNKLSAKKTPPIKIDRPLHTTAKKLTPEQLAKKQLQIHTNQQRQREKQQLKQQQQLQDPVYQQQLKAKKLRAIQQQQQKQIAKQQLNKQAPISPVKKRPVLKSKGLKGRPYNAEEKRLASKLASIGCICCINQGWIQTHSSNETGLQFISLHHVEGRTKAWAHAKVLPLCHYHHQTEAPPHAPAELFPLHGNAKTHWERINGTQEALLEQVYAMIDEERPWLHNETADITEPT